MSTVRSSTLRLAISGAILAVVLATPSTLYSQTDRSVMRKTLSLPDGQVVCDLNGDWDAQIENYGIWISGGTYPQIIRITQQGSLFTSIRMLDDRNMRKGSDSVRGELSSTGFKTVQLMAPSGPLDAKGTISGDCNKMMVDDGEKVRVTYTRK